MRKHLLVLFAVCFTATSFSQDFSNKGKEFWLAYSYHVGMVNSGGSPVVMTLYITSDVNTTYTVAIFGGATIQAGTINANQVIPVVIPNTYFINDEGTFLNKAIHVTAAKPIVVYSYITRSQASAATLCLPNNVLGKQYYAMSFTQVSNENNSNSFITIVAVEDNTSVEIIPTAATKSGWVAGSTNIININKGQIYQVLGTTTGNNGVDLSGSSIRSVASGTTGCKRIAVFSGTGKISIGCAGGPQSSDNLYQQLYPASSWGKKYLTVPSYNRPNNYFRILKSSAAANVYLNGALVPAGSFTNNYYEFFNNIPNLVESDLPVCVTQYFTTQNCGGNGNPYDPDMIVLNPVEQNINKVTLINSNLTVAGTHEHNLHIVMRNKGAGSTAFSSFKYDGISIPPSAWVIHPAEPNYSYLYFPNATVPNVTETSHTLASDSGFNAIAYGYGNAETYGYSAGTNVKDLYQQIGVTSQYGIEQTPNVCTGSPFKFKVSLPYKADSMYWDFHGASPNPPAPAMVNVMMNSPQPLPFDSTTTVNGKIIYWYSLPAIYTFNTIGIYPVTITTYTANSDGCGNTQEIDFDLEVSDPPVADFTWVSNGCVNQAVQFNDATITVKPLYHWWWNFGDPASGAANNSASIADPIHLFSAPGTYTVRYSNITTPGCLSDTLSKQITVTNIPVAAFNFSSPLCAGLPATVTSTSTASLPGVLAKWYWNLGNGSPAFTALNGNPQVANYAPWGPRTVTLKVETNSGCQSVQVSKTVTINPVPVSKFTHVQACLPYQSVVFTNTSTTADASVLSYLWNFGEASSGGSNISFATNPSHLYSTIGPFNVKLTATNAGGCKKDTTIAITDVRAQARGSFTVNTENCLHDPSVFASTSTGSGAAITTYYWDFGDASPISNTQNPSHTYATAGLKTIKHWVKTVNNCISDTAVRTITVNPLPTGNFNYSSPSCETNRVTFTDASVPNAGTLSAWSWNFDDPSSGTANTSIAKNPVHVFAASGSYDVVLTVTTTKGCVNTFTKSVTVNSRPRAGFIVPEVCLNDTYAQFQDTSTIASGSVTAYQWNFGDVNSTAPNPNTSTIQNPPHSYTSVGSYTVQLIVTSALGCKDTVSHVLAINGSFPVANFTVINPGSLCANDSVRITNTSTVFPGVITKTEIYWDNVGQASVFETDNDPIPGGTYSHLYPNFQTPLTKNFTIRFRAYSGGVCVNDKLQNITVNAAPKVQFNALPNTCLNIAPFQITQASEVGAVPGSFVFTGPGVSATGMFNPVATGAGVFTIHYIYTSNTGCRDSATQQIKVLQAPVAKFGFGTPACENKTVLFTDSSTSSVGTLTTWTWDFADGSVPEIRSSAAPFTHTFTNAGTFQVKLIVKTSDGCNSLVKQRTVIIAPQPKPGFTFADTACLPNAVINFNNISSIANGTENTFTYLWNFGDPSSGLSNISSAKNPTHIYATAGPFNVKLQVTSGALCVHDTIIVLNTIHPQPKADFDFSKPSVCIGGEVIFRDQSDGKDGSVNAWSWSFGDNQSSSLQNPPHTYSDAKEYNVKLFIVNSFGCNSDTITKRYNVYPYPVVNAGPDRFVLEGGVTVIQPTATGNDLQFLWKPSLYLNSSIIKAPTCKPLADINYTLEVTARGGCMSSDDVFVKVLMAPRIPNTITANGDGIHDKWEILYLDTYPNCRVQVFTRTGQLVFESRGYATPWNATMNGKALPVDTYYYIIEPESGRKPITGYVTIIK